MTLTAAELQRTDAVASTVAVVALLALHFLARPMLVGWAAAPDLLAGGLLLAALRLRAGHAAILGFVLGVLDGAMALGDLGMYAFVLSAVAFLAARSRDLLFSDARFFMAAYLFLGTLLVRSALILLGGGETAVLPTIGAAIVTALSTTVLCVMIDSVASPTGR